MKLIKDLKPGEGYMYTTDGVFKLRRNGKYLLAIDYDDPKKVEIKRFSLCK